MEPTSVHEYSRRRQEKRNHVQYFGVAQVRIIEAGSIEEDHPSSIKGELIGDFDLVGA